MISGRCYTTKADVIAYYICVLYYGWCYCHSCGRCYYHFVFSIHVADVIAMCVWQMVITTEADVIAYYVYILADVIANIVADVIATECNVLADGIAKWQME